MREKLEKSYPDLKSLFSEDFLENETVFSVGDKNNINVSELGIIYLDESNFQFVVNALSEFFKSTKNGAELKTACNGLKELLSGGIYVNRTINV